MLLLPKTEIAESLDKFIWSFKIGDNIVYNFRVLFSLYDAKTKASKHGELFIKPIFVTIVAIVEAIFFDLMARLSVATNHFPHNLRSNRGKIKQQIEKDKVRQKQGGGKRLKNYKMSEYEKFFSAYEIFGKAAAPIYSELKYVSKIRNRIHIQNYFGGTHPDEENLFGEEELKRAEVALEHVLKIMASLYPRPFPGPENFKAWVAQLGMVA